MYRVLAATTSGWAALALWSSARLLIETIKLFRSAIMFG
jgi:hypothetical protein